MRRYPSFCSGECSAAMFKSAAALGLHLAVTTGGDGVHERVVATEYFITQTPSPLAAATAFACSATATTVFLSALKCSIKRYKRIPSRFSCFYSIFCHSSCRSAPLLPVDYFTIVVAILPLRSARGIRCSTWVATERCGQK